MQNKFTTFRKNIVLFIFNKQEFMPFTFWHIMVYVTLGLLGRYLFMGKWYSNGGFQGWSFLITTSIVLPFAIAIHQFWRRFYSACATQQYKQSLMQSLFFLLHAHATLPFWAYFLALGGGLFFKGGTSYIFNATSLFDLLFSLWLYFLIMLGISIGVAMYFSVISTLTLSTLLYFFISRKRN